jgi:hypothetical protein
MFGFQIFVFVRSFENREGKISHFVRDDNRCRFERTREIFPIVSERKLTMEILFCWVGGALSVASGGARLIKALLSRGC